MTSDDAAFERMIDAIERYCAYHRHHESEMSEWVGFGSVQVDGCESRGWAPSLAF
jgi:hypothetical protein